MATVKKGMMTPPNEWWKHLRWAKRAFWKGERKAVKTALTNARRDD
jgi:hypothetical protein